MSVPTFEDLPIKPEYPPHSAWGVWGEKDELGTLNFLTRDRLLAAKEEIQLGERVTINWPMNLPLHPCFGRQPFHHRIISKHPRTVNDDVLTFNTQSGSQWDGLRHYGWNGKYYNGVTNEDIREGLTLRDGIHVMAEAGVAGRGVLLDYFAYARRNGIHYNTHDTHVITLDELEACRRDQGTEYKKGDILLIRVGFTGGLSAFTSEEQKDIATRQPSRFPGVECDVRVVKWIWDNQFAAVGGDAPAWEAQPMGDRPLHEYILGGLGCSIAELLDLERLSAVCEREKRWSFFFTAAPLNVPGGIASPTNAMCLL